MELYQDKPEAVKTETVDATAKNILSAWVNRVQIYALSWFLGCYSEQKIAVSLRN